LRVGDMLEAIFKRIFKFEKLPLDKLSKILYFNSRY